MQARGSQACRDSLAEEGALIALDAEVLVAAELEFALEELAAPLVEEFDFAGAGALTANCVPVTTVTCAPLVTAAGS